MALQQELQILEQQLAEVRQQKVQLQQTQTAINPQNELQSLEQQLAEVRKQKEQAQFSWPRFLAEQTGKGALGVADVFHQFGDAYRPNIGQITKDSPPGNPTFNEMISGGKGFQKPSTMLEETQIPTTPGQRIAGHGARMAGASAVLPVGGFLKNIATGTGLGLTSGALQETGAPPLLADIMSVLGFAGGPAAARGIKNLAPSVRGEKQAAKMMENVIGKEKIPDVIEALEQRAQTPFHPTTAELANSPGLAATQTAYRGTLKHPSLPEGVSERAANQQALIEEELRNMRGEGSAGPEAAHEYITDLERAKAETKASQSENALSQFENKMEPEEAGQIIREQMGNEASKRRAARREKVGEPYEQLENIEADINPKTTLEYIEKEGKNALEGTDSKAIFDKYGKMFGVGGKKEIIVSPAGRETTVWTNAMPVQKLERGLQELTNDIGKAKRVGARNDLRILNDIEKKLNSDLSIHPEVSTARKAYAEASKDVNELLLHPEFKKMLKTTDFEAHHLMPDSAIPKKIVNSSERSISDAGDFIKMFGKNKKVMDAVEGYLNQRVVSEIIDGSGNINHSKIAQFKKKNPGAFVLYPSLETKLANASNATGFVNKSAKVNFKTNTDHYNDMMKTVTGNDADKMIKSLFGSKYSAEKIKEFKKTLTADKTGQAWEGARRSAVDYVSEHAVSPHKFMRFYHDNIANLKEFFTPDQMKVLENIYKHYGRQMKTQKLASTVGSHTAARQTIMAATEGEKGLGNTILEKMLHPMAGGLTGSIFGGPTGAIIGAGAAGAAGYWKSAVSKSFQENVQRILLDTNYAKAVLENQLTKAGREATKDAMGKWRKAYLLGYPIAKDLNEEK